MIVAALSSPIPLFTSSCVYLFASLQETFGLVTISTFTSGKMLLVSSSVAFLSNFILEILFIPKYQMIGASIGYSFITVVSFFIMYYYARKFEILKFKLAKKAKIYASGS